MDKLPIPKDRPGWLASIVSTMLVFAFYYLGGGYQAMLNYYLSQIYSVTESGILASPFDDVTVKLSLPNYTANFGKRWAFVTVVNNGGTVFNDVTLWVELGGESEYLSTTPESELLLLPFMIEEMLFERSLDIGILHPQTQVSGRVPIVSSSISNTHIEAVWISGTVGDSKNIQMQGEWQVQEVNFGGSNGNTRGTLPLIRFNSSKALKHSIAESVLLPPWSNSLIPVLVLVVCWFVENAVCNPTKDKKAPSLGEGKGWICFGKIIAVALVLLSGLVIFGGIAFGIIENSIGFYFFGILGTLLGAYWIWKTWKERN
jgi:hypothetical protein